MSEGFENRDSTGCYDVLVRFFFHNDKGEFKELTDVLTIVTPVRNLKESVDILKLSLLKEKIELYAYQILKY